MPRLSTRVRPLPPSWVIVVRRSAHILPTPLQNVRTSKCSAKRGNLSTLMRGSPDYPDGVVRHAGVLDVRVGDVLQPSRQSVEPDRPDGAQSASPGRIVSLNSRPPGGGPTNSVNCGLDHAGSGPCKRAAVRRAVVLAQRSRAQQTQHQHDHPEDGEDPPARMGGRRESGPSAPLTPPPATAPTTATPRVWPTWRLVEATAAATPACEGGMPETAVLVIGGLTRPKPSPNTT